MIGVWSWRLMFVASCIALSCANATEYTTNVSETGIYKTEAPIIIPSKKEIVLQKGQNFTLICKGSDEIQIKQQEIPEEIVESLFNKTHATFATSETPYKYLAELTLHNVDQFAVGYYACFDSTVNGDDVLNNLMAEPNDTEHVTYVYIYVNGTNTLFAPMREVVTATTGSKVVIGCRPTTPDVKVTLTREFPDIVHERYDPKIGFVFDSDVFWDMVIIYCDFMGRDIEENKTIFVHKHSNVPPPKPKIIGGSEYFISGEDFSLNCTATYQSNSALILFWKFPNVGSKVIIRTNENETTGGILFNNITIANATAADAGNYTCISKNTHGQINASFVKKHLDEGIIEWRRGPYSKIETAQSFLRLLVRITDYPRATITFLRDGKELPMNKKYSFERTHSTGDIKLTIKGLTVDDTANYTFVASNKYTTKNITYDVRVKAPPVIDFGPNTDMKYVKGTEANMKCKAKGYPTPDIKWIFTTSKGDEQILAATKTVGTLTTMTSYISIPVHESGTITCEATNRNDKDGVNEKSESRKFLVYEMPNGFGIQSSDQTWFHERQDVVLTCVASIYDYENLTWTRADDVDPLDNVDYYDNEYSSVADLRIDKISLEGAGNYTCRAFKYDNTEENITMAITVAAIRPPVITDPTKEEYKEVFPNLPLQLTCQADAVPRPQILWYKDGIQLVNGSKIVIVSEPLDHTKLNSTVMIQQMEEENRGKYECVATNNVTPEIREFFNVALIEKPTNKAAYLSVIGGIVFILLLLIVYLAWKIRKEKQFRKELAAAGLLYFKEGVTKSINPELGIDEQAELLPYDDRFEFPPEKLVLGKQLGAGAFGVVYKADARGIINAEETTPVAVKMVKKTADNMYIKALATELKIMVHLGKHVNIVNLLGACTKNVGKRELIVIVEYCKFGNIHNYLQKHREVFIDQLTDNKEKNLGKVNKGFLSSSGSSAMHSDYFSSNQTQETDHTFLNTGNTSRSGRKVSETGYVQPEWRSNYETDYSDGRAPRPLFSRDLLAWAFQIARGMEYLASRKVLHGDLAARNVLLAEDNIVKICDFGLARSIYKNDEYQKKENSPLPVKWLAIECMTDRIFSTQSDVWSFGIVLWELFSLAKTPYPNINLPSLLQWLSEGHRLEKPTYANDRLYDVMLRCWAQKPTARPSFTQLQEILGEFLEDNVRNHYVDLNSAYVDMNTKVEGQEDYLAMVCAPDYNNLVTPSPHHYVNDTRSFFPPTPTQYDDEGYLQMSPTNQNIFSPRTTNTKFDFDAKALSPRTEATSHGSESTPMLTLNRLPASGSESDPENSSPYLNMYPRIEEETDDVFEKNMKNVENGAVTNPTYITFDVDIEKKPRDNNYINVPNGLVK